MNFAEYVEKVSKQSLTKGQKDFLNNFEKVNKNCGVYCLYPTRIGKQYILRMWRMYIEEYEKLK